MTTFVLTKSTLLHVHLSSYRMFQIIRVTVTRTYHFILHVLAPNILLACVNYDDEPPEYSALLEIKDQ